MLGDQGLFSQVISWDSRYTDFYSLRATGATGSLLQSHSKKFGSFNLKQNFPGNIPIRSPVADADSLLI